MKYCRLLPYRCELLKGDIQCLQQPRVSARHTVGPQYGFLASVAGLEYLHRQRTNTSAIHVIVEYDTAWPGPIDVGESDTRHTSKEISGYNPYISWIN